MIGRQGLDDQLLHTRDEAVTLSGHCNKVVYAGEIPAPAHRTVWSDDLKSQIQHLPIRVDCEQWDLKLVSRTRISNK